MEDLLVFDPLSIRSHWGQYNVFFDDDALGRLNNSFNAETHFLIDKKVAGLYGDVLDRVICSQSVLFIEAVEANKSLHKFPEYVEHLVSKSIRKNHRLIAIGGGIIQDITCFLAATLLRGLPWHFYPTTLLAQADSCIGSKSSINVGKTKNILGTFTPPEQVYICTDVLKTLEEPEIHSGIGEMLKVHAIEGPESFNRIASDYERMFADLSVMKNYIYRSLEIKKPIIELDEFDSGPRNIMNYGHSFGHAIESATDFTVPHGIAVTIGMDMANFVAFNLGKTDICHYERMHQILRDNARSYEDIKIPPEEFFSALYKDKKNSSTNLKLVFPDSEAKIAVGFFSNDDKFKNLCIKYFREVRF
jgi:3-dehydroquinate synthase